LISSKKTLLGWQIIILKKKMIKIMQTGSRIMVKAHNQKGSQTIDHYSLLGFTKAYKATKANCS